MTTKTWTEDDATYLREHYKSQPVEITASTLDRSVSSVWSKARGLGLHRPHLTSTEATKIIDAIPEREIYWMAGILEGEAVFADTKSGPVVTLRMTDKDIVDRVADLVKSKGVQKTSNGEGRKDLYRVTIGGHLAKVLMKRIYPIMGTRRRSRVDYLCK